MNFHALIHSKEAASLAASLCTGGQGNWRRTQWGGPCCLSPYLCSGNWGVSLQVPEFTFCLAEGGHMTAASECSEGLFAFTWHWQAVRQSNTTERKYSLFPWHHPARNRGERRGHSWWQPQYHLLLTNSSCRFTYKFALCELQRRLHDDHHSLIIFNFSAQTCFFLFLVTKKQLNILVNASTSLLLLLLN